MAVSLCIVNPYPLADFRATEHYNIPSMNELIVVGAFSEEEISWCAGGEPCVLTEEHFKEMGEREEKLKALIQTMQVFHRKAEQCVNSQSS